jgi:hypothetical protein
MAMVLERKILTDMFPPFKGCKIDLFDPSLRDGESDKKIFHYSEFVKGNP